MDRFLAPHTPEALAHSLITQNWHHWSVEYPSLAETLIAGCASYGALDRYLSGADLVLLPRTRSELESILRRYCYDAIHNAISISRVPLESGGYSRICHLAEKSIRDVLDTKDNVKILLALHRAPKMESTHDAEDRSVASIATK
ncbi:hypothetical protein AMATHDRAFT_56110 [Amanita thiersii Skay4041]|uniref:Uncharacterized protein n=1 Tax=Amanita thiersii Skay4041 TaxID=703135 RepID=A0A2A9NP25_9AGAR|nr:hypothetical protein AMATHDRAFT_56110 [Amanita thiersii Skay4041]